MNLPRDVNTEKSINAAIILFSDDSVEAFEILDQSDFYDANQGNIFKKLKELHTDGVTIDENALNAAFNGRVGDLIRIIVQEPIPANLQQACQRLRDVALKRNAIIRLSKALNSLQNANSEETAAILEEVKNLESPTGLKPKKLIFEQVGLLSIKAVEWLIKGLIETGSTSLTFGDPGTYKSFLAIAWACCVASGKDFLGRVVRQGLVIYIAGEGQNGIVRRILAWCIRNGVDIKALPLFVSKMPAGLCDADQVKFVKSAIDDVVKEHGQPVLIVIDTLARNFGGGDENSTQDMTRFVESLDFLRVTYDSTILIVHHTGHSNKDRSRGAMALKAALDSEFRLDVDETGVIRMECTKMKDAEIPEPMAFKTAVVELGLNDEEGNPVTSVVLEETGYTPPTKTGKEGRGRWQKVAVEVLEGLCSEHRNNLKSRGFSEETARVTVNDWQQACVDKGMSREAWRRIKNKPPKGIAIQHGFAEFS